MILIPTLQSDGTVAYAVQQNSFHPPCLPIQPGPGQALINQTTTVIPASQTSPSKVQHKVGLLRHNSLKHKNILPKTFQPQPVSLTGDRRTPSYGPRVAAAVQKVSPSEAQCGPGNLLNRKIQVRRSAGESKTLALSYSGAEVNIRCDQQLSQLELHHVQSIIRQAQPGQSGQQVYRVVTPNTPPDIVNLEQQRDAGKEEEDKEQHFSVAAFVREFSSRRGRGKKHRGRPRKGTSKINEKKVITELRREFGIRNEWSRLKS